MITLNMDLLKMDKPFLKDTFVILGLFDGVHLAHKDLIEFGVKKAEEEGFSSAVFTFDKNFKKGGYLTSNFEKESIIENLGADNLIFQNINDCFLNLAPQELVTLLKDKLNAKAIAVGENYKFGKDKKGDVNTLKELCDKMGINLFVKPLLEKEGEIISSSLVKKCLKDGDIIKANSLLGREYFICGKVEKGNQIGNTLGFPTVNIYPDGTRHLPKYGVYKTKVNTPFGEYFGITNVGVKPTVDKNRLSVETHIKGFDKDIYGKEIKVSFSEFIRPEKKFLSLKELKEQIKEDLTKWKLK